MEIQGARACSEHEHEHGEHARTCSGSADLQNPVLGLARARPCSKIPRARLCSCSADLKMPCSGSLVLPSTKLTYFFNIFALRIQRLSLSTLAAKKCTELEWTWLSRFHLRSRAGLAQPWGPVRPSRAFLKKRLTGPCGPFPPLRACLALTRPFRKRRLFAHNQLVIVIIMH